MRSDVRRSSECSEGVKKSIPRIDFKFKKLLSTNWTFWKGEHERADASENTKLSEFEFLRVPEKSFKTRIKQTGLENKLQSCAPSCQFGSRNQLFYAILIPIICCVLIATLEFWAYNSQAQKENSLLNFDTTMNKFGWTTLTQRHYRGGQVMTIVLLLSYSENRKNNDLACKKFCKVTSTSCPSLFSTVQLMVSI